MEAENILHGVLPLAAEPPLLGSACLQGLGHSGNSQRWNAGVGRRQ